MHGSLDQCQTLNIQTMIKRIQLLFVLTLAD